MYVERKLCTLVQKCKALKLETDERIDLLEWERVGFKRGKGRKRKKTWEEGFLLPTTHRNYRAHGKMGRGNDKTASVTNAYTWKESQGREQLAALAE